MCLQGFTKGSRIPTGNLLTTAAGAPRSGAILMTRMLPVAVLSALVFASPLGEIADQGDRESSPKEQPATALPVGDPAPPWKATRWLRPVPAALLHQINAGGAKKGYQFSVANAPRWAKSFPFRPEIRKVTKDNCRADVGTLAFARGAEGARRTINTWLAKDTPDKILDLFVAGCLIILIMLPISTAILILAMFISSALGGGIEFGDARVVIPKAAALLLVVNLIGLVPCGLVIAFPVWAFGLMKLFHLDLWETRILLIVNWTLNFLAQMAVIFVVMAALGHAFD